MELLAAVTVGVKADRPTAVVAVSKRIGECAAASGNAVELGRTRRLLELRSEVSLRLRQSWRLRRHFGEPDGIPDILHCKPNFGGVDTLARPYPMFVYKNKQPHKVEVVVGAAVTVEGLDQIDDGLHVLRRGQRDLEVAALHGKCVELCVKLLHELAPDYRLVRARWPRNDGESTKRDDLVGVGV
jgi:hypothetical protein